MKKLLSLLVIILLLNSCQESPDYALLSGNVLNPKTEIITILDGREKLQDIVIKEDGSFADTLKVEPGYYRLAHGNESGTIYIAPGYDLQMELDTAEFDESMNFSGTGAEVNNYLSAKYLANEKTIGDIPTHYSLDEKAYSEKVLAMKDERLKALQQAGITDKNFRSLEAQNLEYEYMGLLTRYESYHKYYTKQDDFETSEDFPVEDIKKIVFNDSDAYEKVPSYKSLANNVVSSRIYDAIGDDYQSAEVAHFAALDSVEIPALKKDIISGMGQFLLSPANPNMKSLYDYFISNVEDEKLKKTLQTKFEKNKSLLPGMPSPVFVNYENHKGGTTSLEDLKGKYVYIDVWATWCAPCKREIPYLKEIESQYEGKNIEFVSTSIDNARDHSKWVDMVNDKQLKGIQLFADNDWNSKFVKDYAIEGIPRFILVDPEGNIISADAPRPSNPKLVELFEELKI